jgi:hypothetical protein
MSVVSSKSKCGLAKSPVNYAVTAPVRTTFARTVEFLNVSGVANVGIAVAVALRRCALET